MSQACWRRLQGRSALIERRQPFHTVSNGEQLAITGRAAQRPLHSEIVSIVGHFMTEYSDLELRLIVRRMLERHEAFDVRFRRYAYWRRL